MKAPHLQSKFIITEQLQLCLQIPIYAKHACSLLNVVTIFFPFVRHSSVFLQFKQKHQNKSDFIQLRSQAVLDLFWQLLTLYHGANLNEFLPFAESNIRYVHQTHQPLGNVNSYPGWLYWLYSVLAPAPCKCFEKNPFYVATSCFRLFYDANFALS